KMLSPNDTEESNINKIELNQAQIERRKEAVALMKNYFQQVENNNQNPELAANPANNPPANQEQEAETIERTEDHPIETNPANSKSNIEEKTEPVETNKVEKEPKNSNTSPENIISAAEKISDNPQPKKEDIADALDQLNTLANAKPNTPEKNAWEK